MDDLIGRVVADTGADRTVAEGAVGIIRQFLRKAIPAQGRADRIVFTRCLPSMFGHTDALIGAGPHLTGTGRSLGWIQAATRESIRFAVKKQGKTQSARSSARFPASAGSFDA